MSRCLLFIQYVHVFACFGAFLCTHYLLRSQIKTDFIHSPSAARTLAVLQICSAASGLLMILTFKISYSHVEYAHIHVLLVHAHTLARSPPVTVMTLTFLFVMMCGGNVYLWGANSFLLIGSLLPPPTHKHPAITHAHTHTGD